MVFELNSGLLHDTTDAFGNEQSGSSFL